MRPISRSIFPALLLLLTTFLAPLAADTTTKEKILPCPQCMGAGTAKCTTNHCQDGKADCPGNCLNLNRGKWEHMDVKGHAYIPVWQKFKKANGGFSTWNGHHLGEVVEHLNGDPVLTGECKVCGGTTQITCTTPVSPPAPFVWDATL